MSSYNISNFIKDIEFITYLPSHDFTIGFGSAAGADPGDWPSGVWFGASAIGGASTGEGGVGAVITTRLGGGFTSGAATEATEGFALFTCTNYMPYF